jgi:hypothetical protein
MKLLQGENHKAKIFIYGLFNDAVSNLDYLLPKVRKTMNNEQERMWKEAFVAKFETLPRHLP